MASLTSSLSSGAADGIVVSFDRTLLLENIIIKLHNHGHNSVVKGQKHRKNPSPLSLSMLIYNSVVLKCLRSFFFVLQH